MRSGIYRIICMITGMSYIGQSKNIDKRIEVHFKKLILGKHSNKHLQSAFNLYSAENFVAEIIEVCSVDDLIDREQFWIDNYGFENLYNMRPAAGSNLGHKWTDESKRKQSETQRKAMKGHIVSEETRKKISIARKGKSLSEEHKAKIGLAHKNMRKPSTRKGKKTPELTKAKISESVKKYWAKRKKEL